MTDYTSDGKPITAERIERALDAVARYIVELGREGPVVLPIYRRLKAELAKLQAEKAEMEEIRERARLFRQKRRGRKPKSSPE